MIALTAYQKFNQHLEITRNYNMKLWKTILLQTGIFTSVFALGAGAGFLTNYHKGETKEAAPILTQAESEDDVYIETAADKFLGNLTSSKALAGDIDLHVTKAEEITTDNGVTSRRALADFDIGDIDLSIKNLQVSIADLDNIKVSGDINVKMGSLDVSASVTYVDSTIYLDYNETEHFYLKTEDITDVMDMLPTFGMNLEVPEEFQNLDLDALTNSLGNMEEVENLEEHYFLFNFSDDIQIKLLSDENYHLIGVELPAAKLLGMEISATSSIHTLEEDIEDLGKPDYEYVNFQPAFNLVNGVMDLVNKKEARVALDLDVTKVSEQKDFINLDGNIDFSVNDLAVFADLCLKETTRTHNIQAAYMDSTVYASYKNVNVSITNQSIQSLVEYIKGYLSSEQLDEIMNKFGSLNKEIDLDIILGYVTVLPKFISDFTLTSNSLSLNLNPHYFGLNDISEFNIAINFDEDSIKSVKISDFVYGDYQIDLSLSLSDYVQVEIDKNKYVALDPAVSLFGAVENLLKQDKFGVEFEIMTDDYNSETNTYLSANGEFWFGLKTREFDVLDEQGNVIGKEEKPWFGFGAGEMTIVDGDGYNHHIVVDAQKAESQVLLGYNDKIFAKFDNETVDNTVALVKEIINDPDEHMQEIMDLLSSMTDKAKALPIANVIAGDYLSLLDYDIIQSLDVTDTEVSLGINGALFGMDDKVIDIVISYEDETLKGITVSGIILGEKEISIELNLKEFNQGKYESFLMDETAHNYMDLSTIYMLLKLGINTSEFNYWHFQGTIKLTLLDIIGKTMDADVKIYNDHGHTRVLAHLWNIPAVMGVNIETNDIGSAFSNFFSALTSSREAYLLFDNQEGGAPGMFEIYSVCRRKILGFFKSDTYTYSKYTQEYMVSHIMEVLCQDIIGLTDGMMEKITNSQIDSDKQIVYEDIIEKYKYDENEQSYYFGINVGVLANNDDFGTLGLTVYNNFIPSDSEASKFSNILQDEEMLNRVKIDMSMNPGVSMVINMDMYLVNDCSVTTENAADLDKLTAYFEKHRSDEINHKYTGSKDSILPLFNS